MDIIKKLNSNKEHQKIVITKLILQVSRLKEINYEFYSMKSFARVN